MQWFFLQEIYAMKKLTRILAGVCTLIVGLSLALPIRAGAEVNDHEHHHYGHHNEARHWDHDDHRYDNNQAWRWQREKNHYRAYPYTPPPGYAYSYRQRYQYLPENGEGMINPRNPNLYWACDSEGHHCHWAPRGHR